MKTMLGLLLLSMALAFPDLAAGAGEVITVYKDAT